MIARTALYALLIDALLIWTTLLAPQQASAQIAPEFTNLVFESINEWENQAGIIVTPDARTQILFTAASPPREWANQFDPSLLGNAGSNDSGFWSQPCLSRSGIRCDEAPAVSHQLSDLVRRISFGLLSEFPTIHVAVSPLPPRDYNVVIDGTNFGVPPKDFFKVPSDTDVTVIVTRSGKPACQWQGRPEERQVDVNCQF